MIGGWTGTLSEDRKLVDETGLADDEFGLSVSVESDTAIVGAPETLTGRPGKAFAAADKHLLGFAVPPQDQRPLVALVMDVDQVSAVRRPGRIRFIAGTAGAGACAGTAWVACGSW